MTSPSSGYTPLWSTDAAETKALAAWADDIPVARDYARGIGDRLRSEFPDVDQALVGWVALRTLTCMAEVRRAQDLPFRDAWYVMFMACGHLVEVD